MGALVSAMPARGGEPRVLWAGENAALGVARLPWEDAVIPGGIGIPDGQGVAFVADATLYNTPELVTELRAAGIELESDAPAVVMQAAYRVWGPSFALHLNGDFAFALWDERRQELIVGRDFVGRRSLFTRELPDGVIIASQAGALARSGSTATLNLPFIAAAVAGLLSGSRESAYLGVVPVPAGAVLAWSASRGWRTAAKWEPPTFRAKGGVDLREGGEELRRLLTEAVVRRCGADRVAFYLSGGADSPAVFAVAAAARERGALNASLQPISVSFPPGDSAREDEHIIEIARHWGATPRWVQSEDMDLFERQQERATNRDDPYAHTFEQMNRHLGRSAASAGAVVALDGHGGDLLFQVSDAAIAEVLMSGDVRTWRRLLRDGGYQTLQERLRWGLLPLLPNVMWRTLDAFRARPLQRPFTQDLPSWLTARASGRLQERGWQRSEVPRHWLEGPASYESRWYLTAPYMARATAWTHEVAQQCQVELRSPILDQNVVEFAASRPLLERASVTETKPLLRAAMQGLLPESALAPRSYKTGVPRGYLGRQIQRGLDRAMERLSLGEPVRSTWVLADLGIIEVGQLNERIEAYRTTQDHLTGVQIFLTIEAEFWLRNHDWFTPAAW